MPVAVIRYQYDNHLGSASLELDATAQIISYEEYHPFGSTSYRSGKSETEVSLKRYKYVGKERDEETGLYYYGFRYYAPWIARFINVDPLQHEYPHYTPFQYAGNKPITYVDLDGLEEGLNNHREGDQRVEKFNSINTILPTFQYKTYYWHTGTQKEIDEINEDGKTVKATIGYAPGWYSEDAYFNITKDVVTNKNLVFSEGTKFAAHWNTIASAAYLKKYENSDFWINPSTEKWELNPHSFKGIYQDNIIFDIAGFAYSFSMIKIGAKSIANQIPSASKKIVSEVVEEGVEELATKGGMNAYETALAGGKHSGWLNTMSKLPTDKLQKSITSMEANILEHQNLISNPSKYLQQYGKGNWDLLDPRRQQHLLKVKWPSDIQRAQEQINILQGIIKSR